MARRYLLRKRQNQILYFEVVVAAGVLSLVLRELLHHHWAYMIITFIVFVYSLIFSFFRWRLFRYIVTVLFSMVYGLFAYIMGRVVDPDTFTAGLVFAFIAYFVSILAHKDHFDFLAKANMVEYEKHSF